MNVCVHKTQKERVTETEKKSLTNTHACTMAEQKKFFTLSIVINTILFAC